MYVGVYVCIPFMTCTKMHVNPCVHISICIRVLTYRYLVIIKIPFQFHCHLHLAKESNLLAVRWHTKNTNFNLTKSFRFLKRLRFGEYCPSPRPLQLLRCVCSTSCIRKRYNMVRKMM